MQLGKESGKNQIMQFSWHEDIYAMSSTMTKYFYSSLPKKEITVTIMHMQYNEKMAPKIATS